MLRSAAALAFLLAGPGAELAWGQGPPALSDAAKALLGGWEISDADRDRTCGVTFRGEAAAGGLKLDLDPTCATAFPATKDIAAWSLAPDGTLRLTDAAGRPVLELTEVESGIYDGFRPGEGRYVLQNSAAGPVLKADDLFGDWAVARGTGKPICTLTLANTAASGDYFALRLKPGCDALVARFGPTTWRIDRGELILSSPRGQSWRFEQNDANTWQRVPATPDPVLLVRQ
jgi:hypothetical protein